MKGMIWLIKSENIAGSMDRFFISKIRYIFQNYAVALVLIAIVILVSLYSHSFLTIQNFDNILKQISVIGILSCGMTLVIISGGIDLSVGSIVSLAGVIVINQVNTMGVLPAIIVTLGTGALLGAISGLILAKIKGRLGEAFIITFGMMSVIASLTMIYSGGIFQQGSGTGLFGKIGLGVAPVIIFIVIIVITQFLLTNTPLGRVIYFLGGNIEATSMSGINVSFYRVMVFTLNGITAAAAAIVLTSRVGAASPAAGTGYELDAIAAVVVGGVSLSGGRGSMINTVLGVVVMGVLGNALNIMNISSYPQNIIKGIIIILAVGIDIWNKNRQWKV